MKVLFICNQNQNRSRTAEELFKGKFQTKSAGLYNESSLTEKQLSWADLVVVMEDGQRTEISRRFPKLYMQKRIISLNIPDNYYYKQPKLMNILKSKMNLANLRAGDGTFRDSFEPASPVKDTRF